MGKTGEVKVTKDGGDIDALTGATITSRRRLRGRHQRHRRRREHGLRRVIEYERDETI